MSIFGICFILHIQVLYSCCEIKFRFCSEFIIFGDSCEDLDALNVLCNTYNLDIKLILFQKLVLLSKRTNFAFMQKS